MVKIFLLQDRVGDRAFRWINVKEHLVKLTNNFILWSHLFYLFLSGFWIFVFSFLCVLSEKKHCQVRKKLQLQNGFKFSVTRKKNSHSSAATIYSPYTVFFVCVSTFMLPYCPLFCFALLFKYSLWLCYITVCSQVLVLSRVFYYSIYSQCFRENCQRLLNG